MRIQIKCLEGTSVTVTAELSDTIGAIKRKMQEKERIPADQHTLMFAGENLEDWHTLADYVELVGRGKPLPDRYHNFSSIATAANHGFVFKRTTLADEERLGDVVKREEAATTLASARRGQLARGDRKSKKKEAADRELAAAKLQAVTRGHQGREAADEVREQKRIEALVAKREADEQRQLADDPTGDGGGSASAFFDGASGMFGAMLGGAMGSGFGGGAPQQRGDARKKGAKKKKDTDGEYFGDGWYVYWSDKHKRPYYYNPETNTTQWYAPDTGLEDDQGVAFQGGGADDPQQVQQGSLFGGLFGAEQSAGGGGGGGAALPSRAVPQVRLGRQAKQVQHSAATVIQTKARQKLGQKEVRDIKIGKQSKKRSAQRRLARQSTEQNTMLPSAAVLAEGALRSYTVAFSRKQPLCLRLKGVANRDKQRGLTSDFVVVSGFDGRADGLPGPAEETGQIGKGDFMVAVNGAELMGMNFNEVMSVLRAATWPLNLDFIANTIVVPPDHEGWAKAVVPGVVGGGAGAGAWGAAKGGAGEPARRRYLQLRTSELSTFKPAEGGAVNPNREGAVDLMDVERIVPVTNWDKPKDERHELWLQIRDAAEADTIKLSFPKEDELDRWVRAIAGVVLLQPAPTKNVGTDPRAPQAERKAATQHRARQVTAAQAAPPPSLFGGLFGGAAAAPSAAALAVSAAHQVGAAVHVNRSGDLWYLAAVHQHTAPQVYTVLYPDGDLEELVPEDRVKQAEEFELEVGDAVECSRGGNKWYPCVVESKAAGGGVAARRVAYDVRFPDGDAEGGLPRARLRVVAGLMYHNDGRRVRIVPAARMKKLQGRANQMRA